MPQSLSHHGQHTHHNLRSAARRQTANRTIDEPRRRSAISFGSQQDTSDYMGTYGTGGHVASASYDRIHDMDKHDYQQSNEFLSTGLYTSAQWAQPNSQHSYNARASGSGPVYASELMDRPPPLPPKPSLYPSTSEARPTRPTIAQLRTQTTGNGIQSYQSEPYHRPNSYEEHVECTVSPGVSEELQGSTSSRTESYSRRSMSNDFPDNDSEPNPSTELLGVPSWSNYYGLEIQSSNQTSNQYWRRPVVHRTSYDEDDDIGHDSDEEFQGGLLREDSYVVVPNAEEDPGLQVASQSESLDNLKEDLLRFQNGKLPPIDDHWHCLVPSTFRENLGKDCVQHQGVLFEVLKSERDYVAGMKALNDVFIQPLRRSQIIPAPRLEDFLRETFLNILEILKCHQEMLEELFDLQLHQHPFINSISHVVLEYTLKFPQIYEAYIKHSPFAEAKHCSEMSKNPKYKAFIEAGLKDSRSKGSKFVDFITAPVRRLPQLCFLLENVLRRTEVGGNDFDQLQMAIGILKDCIKASQPGIQAAEDRIRFKTFIKNLKFEKDEVTDLLSHKDTHSLIHEETLSVKQLSEFSGWYDYHVVLLDHYLVITRKKKQADGTFVLRIHSRPIPLAYLGIDRFDSPPENKREKRGSVIENFRNSNPLVPMYPFTVYHIARKEKHTYTFYAPSEAARKKWYDVILDAMSIYNVKMDVNKWFVPDTINDGAYRIRTNKVPSSSNQQFTGKVISAVTCITSNNCFVAVGTTTGIYLGIRGQSEFRKVLDHTSATTLVALPEHNKFLVLVKEQGILLSYPLNVLALVYMEQLHSQALEAKREQVSGSDKVVFFQVGTVSSKVTVLYAYVRRFSNKTTFNMLELGRAPAQRGVAPSSTFQHIAKPFSVTGTVYGASFFNNVVAIAMDKSIVMVSPNTPNTTIVVPDFSVAKDDSLMIALKTRCDDARALGIVRISENEDMVIYQEFGCYVNRLGFPQRNANHVRWECKATNFALKSEHILLFSDCFVEIRHAQSGVLVQTMRMQDIRLLKAGFLPDTPLLVARKGKINNSEGQSDEIFELVETVELDL